MTSALIIGSFLLGSYYAARKIDGGSASLWLILLLSAVILSVECTAAFNLFDRTSLLIIGLLFVGIILLIERNSVRRWMLKPQWNVRVFFSDYIRIEPAAVRRSLPLCVFFFVIAFFAAFLPIAELDSVSYHLPIASQLIGTGSAWNVFQAGYVGPNTYFPANHEAMLAFLMAVFDTTQMSFLVTMLGVLLFYHALRSLASTGRSVSTVLPALLFGLSFPFLFRQLWNLQIDLFLFSLLGSATAFLIAGIVHRRKMDAVQCLLTLGLALGTKYNALTHAVILLPLLLWLFVRLRLPLRQWISLPLLTMVTGGFWYIRNWILVGNPLYPFGIDVLGWEGHKKIMAEMVQTSLWDAVLSLGVRETLRQVFDNPHFISHLGTVAFSAIAITVAVGIGMLLMLLLRFSVSKSGTRQDIVHACVFAALLYLLCSTAFVYVTSPYTFTLWNEVVRYSAGFIAMLPILLVGAVIVRPRMLLPVNLFALIIAGYNIFMNSFLFSSDVHAFLRTKIAVLPESGFILIAGSILLVLLASVMSMRKARLAGNALWIVLLSVGVSLLAGVVPPSQPLDDSFLLRELSGYERILPAITLLRQEPRDGPPVIALTGLTHYWIFENEGFLPAYLHVDGCDECTYPDYRSEENSVRGHPDEDLWKALVRSRQVDYLLIGSGDENTAAALPEKLWADADKSMFRSLLVTPSISLYKIQAL